MGVRIYQWGQFASYALLTSGTTPVNGDVAQIPLENQMTNWIYDGINLVWRSAYRLYATSADLSALEGVFGGDGVYLTDTGQNAFWDAVHFQWNYVS